MPAAENAPLGDVVLLPPDADPAALRRLEKPAYLLDSAFRVPGTSVRFGLDAALGVVPVVGDMADFFLKADKRNLKLIHDHLRLAPAS